MKTIALGALALLILAPAAGQPDVGELIGPVDDLLGQTVPPVLNQTYAALGQNITREDIRIYVDMNFTKGGFNLLGLVLGSGTAEIQADIHARLEMRVISSERIRAIIEGDNAYNMSSENSTFLTEVFLPAEAFRATLTAETAAQFKEEQQVALAAYLARTVPELEILKLEFSWDNVLPTQAVTDMSLTEPPIVVELDLVLQYVRVESIPSLLEVYFDKDEKKEGKKEYIKELKDDNSDPLRSRDFFAAAAYSQLLNLSMQPGWSLDINMAVPRGYSFTYANEDVDYKDERHISLHVDALAANDEEQQVFLTSITQKRAVALALFGAMWVLGLVLAFPARFLYVRRRLAKISK